MKFDSIDLTLYLQWIFLKNSIFNIIGIITFIFFFSKLLNKYILKSFNSNKLDPIKLGSFAIITGATDGIGKDIATQLAILGFDLILISRSKEKLEETKKEIILITQLNIKKPNIIIIQLDFNTTYEISDYLDSYLKDLDIGLLINNVGSSYPHPMYFNEISSNLLDQLINVNLRSTIQMTHLIYKKMVNKKKGMIICIGSGSSQLPSSPLLTVYACVKAGVESFCRSLQVEAFHNNITIQCQVPLLIATKLSKIKNFSLSVPSSKSYAKSALQSMSKQNPAINGSTICPNWFHDIQICILNISSTFCAWYLFNMHSRLRKRALKKQ